MARRWSLLVVALALASGAAAADGQAVFELREATMKQMGKPFFLVLARTVKGTMPLGPETVSAAESVTALAQKLEPGLFAPGSAVGASKMKPEIFKEPERVATLTQQVRDAVARLTPAAQSGDAAALAAAFKAANEACLACHKSFRAEE